MSEPHNSRGFTRKPKTPCSYLFFLLGEQWTDSALLKVIWTGGFRFFAAPDPQVARSQRGVKSLLWLSPWFSRPTTTSLHLSSQSFAVTLKNIWFLHTILCPCVMGNARSGWLLISRTADGLHTLSWKTKWWPMLTGQNPVPQSSAAPFSRSPLSREPLFKNPHPELLRYQKRGDICMSVFTSAIKPSLSGSKMILHCNVGILSTMVQQEVIILEWGKKSCSLFLLISFVS